MIARRRHRIVIEKRTQSKDASGGSIETWMTFATVWASVEPLRGTDVELSSQLQSDLTHKIVCRSDDIAGIDVSMRIRLPNREDRVLDIDSIKNIRERDQFTEIMCIELAEVS